MKKYPEMIIAVKVIKKYLIPVFLIAVFFPPVLLSQNIDIRVLREINLKRNKSLDGTFKIFTYTAGPVAFGTPVALYGIGLLKTDSMIRNKALYMGTTVLASALISEILKYSVNRPRPFVTYPEIEKNAEGGSPSFPSGHTSDAFSFATSVSLAYPRWFIIVPSYTWAVIVAYSRLDLGVHYPTDVLAGAMIGAMTAYLNYKLIKWMYKK